MHLSILQVELKELFSKGLQLQMEINGDIDNLLLNMWRTLGLSLATAGLSQEMKNKIPTFCD